MKKKKKKSGSKGRREYRGPGSRGEGVSRWWSAFAADSVGRFRGVVEFLQGRVFVGRNAVDFHLFDLLLFFLLLHSSILEPNLDLSLCQAERVRHLDAPPTRQISVEVELFFQLQRLVSRVCLTAALTRRIHA